MSNRTLTILLYHGVTRTLQTGVRNASHKHIFIDEFERQIKFIKQNYNVLSMDEVVDIHATGLGWPENSVAVTFDDGFRNNYISAAPILSHYDCPATFYICAGMVNTNLMFWVDQIEDCIASTNLDRLQVKLDKWCLFSLGSIENRIFAVNAIKRYCKKSSIEEKNNILNYLISQTCITPYASRSDDYQMMTWDEIKKLNSDDLFTIGGHTLYHDIMSAQNQEKIALDIDLTLGLLDYHLHQQTRHFAYPEGQINHYSKLIIEMLQSRGIVCSPSAIDGVNVDEDLFNLKRIMPQFMGRTFPFT